MHTYIRSIVVINFLLIGNSAISQTISGATGKLNLAGTWVASCATEFTDKASMSHSGLCPFVINPDDRSQATMGDFELTFKNDSITINRNNEIKTVAYTMKKKNHTFEFNYLNKNYRFRVFYINNDVILEDKDGMLVLLTKKQS